jgi:response regulator RpfG family c-di-GMP phosphodiesterase
LFLELLDERRETVKQPFGTLGVDYDRTHAELVLTLLRRQVVETTPDGRTVPQSRWIKYGSRVLLAIIEEPEPDRTAILDGIFSDREPVVMRLEAAHDPVSRQRAAKALRAHDFVYDVFEEPALQTA